MTDTEVFFLIKGIISVLSVILLLFHMSTSQKVIRRPQRMRYVSLFGFAVVVAGTSARQIDDHDTVQTENIAMFVVIIFLLLTAIVSICDERTRK
jgi:hypothetical protein